MLMSKAVSVPNLMTTTSNVFEESLFEGQTHGKTGTHVLVYRKLVQRRLRLENEKELSALAVGSFCLLATR